MFNLFKVAVRQDANDVASGVEPNDDYGIGVLRVLGQLAILLPISLLLGLFFGLTSAWVTHKLALAERPMPHLELGLLLLFAFNSYVFTDFIQLPILGGLQFSAIMALFFCAIVMRHYTFHNLSAAAQSTSVILFRTLALLSEASLSLLLGCAAVDYGFQPWAWDWPFICCAILVTLIARAFNIFPMSAVANRFRSTKPITVPMMCAMWFAGLRGGVSFALVMVLDDSPAHHSFLPLVGPRLATATVSCIIFTNVVMGPLTAPVLARLRLTAPKRLSTDAWGASASSPPPGGTNGHNGNGCNGGSAMLPLSARHSGIFGPLLPKDSWDLRMLHLSPPPECVDVSGSAAGSAAGSEVGLRCLAEHSTRPLPPPPRPSMMTTTTQQQHQPSQDQPPSIDLAFPPMPESGEIMPPRNVTARASSGACWMAADAPGRGSDGSGGGRGSSAQEAAIPAFTTSGTLLSHEGLHRRWRTFDERFLKPHFGGMPRTKHGMRTRAIGESDSEDEGGEPEQPCHAPLTRQDDWPAP
mmetsp:Transcript_16243/g.32657  ORF Transcript_16243/g.32657 Transcript_16243/m.32657 type:complete len:526 (-) Transcript_16243:152-1729(-)